MTLYKKGTFYYCDGLSSKQKKLVKNKWDCFDYGGNWINKDLNFDNTLISVFSLY